MCTITIQPNPACEGQNVTITFVDSTKAEETHEATISDAGEDTHTEDAVFNLDGEASVVFSVPTGWTSMRIEMAGCNQTSFDVVPC